MYEGAKMGKKPRDKRRAKLKAVRRETREKEKSQVLYRCLGCGREENIPREVVEGYDSNDFGDLSVPPRFSCTECLEQMEPVFYKSVHGITYEWSKEE